MTVRDSLGSSLGSVRHLRETLLLLAVVLAAANAAPALAGSAEQAPAADRNETTLRVGSASRPDSLNPLVASNRLGRALTTLLYDELLPVSATGEPLPGLIHNWTRSSDGRLWLMDIRPGARWSDGVAVTARDVVHTLRRIQNGPRTELSRWLDGITRVDRFGRLRVGIRLEKPANRPPPLPIPALPRHVWQSVQSDDISDFLNNPAVGSGMFAIESASEGDTMVLTPQRKHWRGSPGFDSLELTFFDSQIEMVAALEAGAIDVADDVAPELLSRLEEAPGTEVRASPASAFVSLGMNTGATRGDGSAVIRRARVRRAIALALDREELRSAVLNSFGQVGSTIVPPALSQHAEPQPGDELAFDPARARKLLELAELNDQDGDGYRESPSGDPLTLRLYTRSAVAETERVGELMAAKLGSVGLRVNTTALTDRELSRRIRHGRYDLFVWGWDVANDPSVIVSVLTCPETRAGGLSDTYFCDDQYDKLYESYASSTSRTKRGKLLTQLQRRAYDQAPYVVLYYRPVFQAFRADRFTAPSDTSTPLVFATAPDPPVSIEFAAGQTGNAPPNASAENPTQASGTDDLLEEISSSLLWRLLAAAVIGTIGVLLLYRIGKFAFKRRRARRVRKAESAHEEAEVQVVDEDTGEIATSANPPGDPDAQR